MVAIRAMFLLLVLHGLALTHALGSGGDPVIVAAGRRFSYILYNGTVQATGSNRFGQLGIGEPSEDSDDLDSNETEPPWDPPADVNRPTDVNLPSGERALGVAAGAFHGLFLTS